ncbi:hypothetical protein NQ318_017119 [Aromia moschata]|uniref:DUF7041 domain-containing protein n=1 Tax=Aromia moschata TaxID=1265417 RepID=A0AAV8XFH9_9CUCU|nr:hypothetical protein NQ318_017119 [Aromia moschata]
MQDRRSPVNRGDRLRCRAGERHRPGEIPTAGNSNRIALKLPPWIPSDPDMWLTLVDRTFDLAKITCEDTKFSYVATALDQSVIVEVRDIVMNPPASEPYKALTKALVNRLSVSQELKTRRLLEKEEMGDSKPSQFLRRLRALAGAAVSDDLLRTLWSGRLPQSVQAIIASQKDSKLDDVAELADAVMASIAPKASVFETSCRADEDRSARCLTSKLVYVRVPVRVSVRGPGRETAAKKTMTTCAGIIASTPRKLTDARNHAHTVPRNRETKRAVVNGGRRQLPYVTLIVYYGHLHEAVGKVVVRTYRGKRDTYGTRFMCLNFGLRRDFVWRFVIADVAKPIIGVDFLAHYGLLVDVGNGRLLDQTTQLTSKGEVVECSVDSIRTVTGSSVFHNLLQKFPQITRPRAMIQTNTGNNHEKLRKMSDETTNYWLLGNLIP